MKATYPDIAQLARLAWGNLLFPFLNPRFGMVPATHLPDDRVAGRRGSERRHAVVRGGRLTLTTRAFSTPRPRAVVLRAWRVLLAFTDTHSRHLPGGRRPGALRRAPDRDVLHRLGRAATSPRGWLGRDGPLRSGVAGAGMFAGGWVVGSIIVGIYLLVSVNVFGRHSEEAFSGLRVEDFKNFLRLHVGRDGHVDHLADEDRARAAPVARSPAGGRHAVARRAARYADAGTDRAADPPCLTPPGSGTDGTRSARMARMTSPLMPGSRFSLTSSTPITRVA